MDSPVIVDATVADLNVSCSDGCDTRIVSQRGPEFPIAAHGHDNTRAMWVWKVFLERERKKTNK